MNHKAIHRASRGRLQVQPAPLVEGRVWRGRDEIRGADVIIKASRSKGDILGEARLLRDLTHPGLVTAWDFGMGDEEGHYWFFTQPFVEGEDIDALSGSLNEEGIFRLARWLLSLVEWLHRQHLVSLDLKPAHVLRDRLRQWKLLDVEQLRRVDPFLHDSLEGTALFLAPEVLLGEAASVASDLYAVGLVIHRALGGQILRPRGETLEAWGRERMEDGPLTLPTGLEIPEPIATLHSALLALDPEERPSSARDALALLGTSGNEPGPLRLGPDIEMEPSLETLRGAWTSLDSGRVMRCGGPPGSGLSRLLRTFTDELQASGAPAFFLSSQEGSISSLFAALGLDSVRGDRVRELQALRGVAETFDKPWALVVDDSHLLEEEYGSLLEQLSQHIEGSWLLLVLGSHRETGPMDLVIPPIGVEGVRELSSALLGPGSLRSADGAATLQALTEGKPQGLRQFLSDLARDPDLRPEGWQGPRGAESALKRLSPPAYRLACVLSHLGPRAPMAVARTAEEGLGDQGLSELLAAGILKSDGGPLAWSGEALRLSLAGRGDGWENLAEALSRLRAEGEDVSSPLLAEACLRGGRAAEGIAWCELALSQGLAPVAEIALRDALGAHLSPGTARSLSNLTSLARLLLDRGRYEELVTRCQSTLIEGRPKAAPLAALVARAELRLGKRAETAGKLSAALPHLKGADFVRAAHNLAWLHLQNKEISEADSVLARARALLPSEPILALEQLYMETQLKEIRGDEPGSLLPPLREALEERDLPSRLKIRLINVTASLAHKSERVDEALSYAGEMIALARETFDLTAEASATLNRANIHRELNQLQEAAEDQLLAAGLFERLGDRHRAFKARLWALDLLVDEGNAQSLNEELKLTETLAVSLAPVEESLERQLARIRLRVGIRSEKRGPEIEALLEAQLDGLDPNSGDEVTLSLLGDLAEFALTHGQHKRAVGILSRWDASSERLGYVGRRLHRLAARAHAGLAGEESKQEGAASGAAEASGVWLERLSALLRASGDSREAAILLARFAGEAVGGRGLILLAGPGRGDVLKGYGLTPEDERQINQVIVQRVLKSGVSERSPDVAVDARLRQVTSLRVGQGRSMVCLPIRSGEDVAAVLYVDHLRHGQEWTDEMYRVLKQYAGMAQEIVELLRAQRRLKEIPPQLDGLVGDSLPMLSLKRDMARLARSPSPRRVYIEGPTGVGKSLIGHLIHELRPKERGPLLQLACGTFLPQLLRAELFGTEPGAFNGSVLKPGVMERVGTGTLILDEVDMIPIESQALLLGALQDGGTFTRMGGTAELSFDGWLISASNRSVGRLVHKREFRDDLERRLKGGGNILLVPGLAERGSDDILLLARHFLGRYLVKAGLGEDPSPKLDDHFTSGAQLALIRHPWPWNVSEMSGIFENSTIEEVLSKKERLTESVMAGVLNKNLTDLGTAAQASSFSVVPAGSLSLSDVKARTDKLVAEYVARCVALEGGNKRAAIRLLKTTPNTFYRYLKMSEDENDDDKCQ